MTAMSDAVHADLIARIYDQLNGRVPMQHAQIRQRAAEIAAEVVAPYVDIVTDLATSFAPLGADHTCIHCGEQPDADDIDQVATAYEDETWHAPTCEWRRAREVCGHPNFRD